MSLCSCVVVVMWLCGYVVVVVVVGCCGCVVIVVVVM